MGFSPQLSQQMEKFMCFGLIDKKTHGHSKKNQKQILASI